MGLTNRELLMKATEGHSASALSLLATRLEQGEITDEEAAEILAAIANTFKSLHASPKQPSAPPTSPLERFRKKLLTVLRPLRIPALLFLSTAGVLYNAVNTFVSMGHLISIIPGLVNPVSFALWATNPLSVALCLFFVVANSCLFWWFEINLLKKSLNCHTSNEVEKILKNDRAELKATNTLNTVLSTLSASERHDDPWTRAVTRIASIATDRIINKKEKYRLGHNEEPVQKFLRYFFTGVGALMNIGGAFFTGQVLLGIVAAPLLGTPIGWIIIGINIVSALGMFISKRLNSPNPKLERFKENEKKIDSCIMISKTQQALLTEQDRAWYSKKHAVKLAPVLLAIKHPPTPRKPSNPCIQENPDTPLASPAATPPSSPASDNNRSAPVSPQLSLGIHGAFPLRNAKNQSPSHEVSKSKTDRPAHQSISA